MNKIKYYMLVGLALGAVSSFAGEDSSFHFMNTARVGYDDNIYLTSDNEQETAFITDIINISGNVTFSSRSDLVLFWQPEFRYRFDADPEFVFYQDLYAKLGHGISERTSIEISDRFRVQDKDGQSDIGTTEDQDYIENNLMAALDFTLSSLSQIKVGGGYEFRTWSDDDYGGGARNNDFDRFKADGSYVRELRPDTTHASVGINYVNHDYNGSRGGYDAATPYVGVDHNFNPNLLGTAQLGYSFASVDGFTGSEDTSNPFVEAGLEYNPTERTSVNGLLGYSMYMAENSVYNAQERFKVGVGVRHDLSGKISLSSLLDYTFSNYDSSYASAGTPGDAKEDYISFSLRGSYQINRNNFVDIGYNITYRDSDSTFLTEYTRNRFDFGWRLRL